MKKWICIAFALLLTLSVCSISGYAFDEEYDYEYDFEPERTTASEVFTTPTQTLPESTTVIPSSTAPSKMVLPPLVRISRENFRRNPRPGEDITLTVQFQNFSNQVSLRNGVASFEPSDGLRLLEKSASKVIHSLGCGSVCTVPVKLHVNEKADNAAQTVSVSYTYTYQTPEGPVNAEKTEKLVINLDMPNNGNGGSNSHATPNIIVTKYDYGNTISAGDTFTLDLQFRNTSAALQAENIVMSIDTGVGISITSASNTYYYNKLSAGGTLSQKIPMRVSPNATPSETNIDISFRYEYVDNGSRSSASTSEKLSIPIVIPDRFQVSAPEMEPIGTQNAEMTISLPYVNKSKTTVSNVQAVLIYDENSIYCEQASQLLGNIDPGRNGTIDFFFVPSECGSGSVKVKITYENELVEEKTIEMTVNYTVEEMHVEDFGEDTMPEEFTDDSGSVKKIVLICVPIVLVVVAVVVIILLKKRKKKKVDAIPAFDWSLPTDSDEEKKA